MRGKRAPGGLLVATGVVTVVLLSAVAAGQEPTAISRLVDRAIELTAAVQDVRTAAEQVWTVRASGLATGLGLGLVVGSVGTFLRWRAQL